MLLSELLEGVEVKEVRGPTDVELRDISYSSGAAGASVAFVAIRGARSDGHATCAVMPEPSAGMPG